VYNSSLHSYTERSWKGVNIIKCADPENKLGTAGQFVYDLNCILDARKRDFDVLLQLGYTSSSVWGRLLPKNALVFTNMDGLEWKRSKYGRITQQFLLRAEKWAVHTSDVLVADSVGIQSYILNKYGKESHFIPYGAELMQGADAKCIEEYGVAPGNYYMLIARMEPENHIETILRGYCQSGDTRPFLVIGKTENEFGRYLLSEFKSHQTIRFLGGIYDLNVLNQLRHFCRLYFHGHSVGGTNPSLLEAMASGALIAAHRNPFNQAVLESDAMYFSNPAEVSECITTSVQSCDTWKQNNLQKITENYSWNRIISQYLGIFDKYLNRPVG
jgi:glycosyltransferase involved in cell wall biosynthesis